MALQIKDKLVQYIEALPDDLQQRVWDFVQALTVSLPQGIPGKQLLKYAGAIRAGDLDLISQAIESGCEQVDDEW